MVKLIEASHPLGLKSMFFFWIMIHDCSCCFSSWPNFHEKVLLHKSKRNRQSLEAWLSSSLFCPLCNYSLLYTLNILQLSLIDDFLKEFSSLPHPWIVSRPQGVVVVNFFYYFLLRFFIMFSARCFFFFCFTLVKRDHEISVFDILFVREYKNHPVIFLRCTYFFFFFLFRISCTQKRDRWNY